MVRTCSTLPNGTPCHLASPAFSPRVAWPVPPSSTPGLPNREAGLHDPSLLPDAGVALARIVRARDAGERVLVFGDFDADGLTGLAILVIALRRFGIDALPYVPSRLDEGHGLSLAALDAAAAAGARLIVTVDCGSTSTAEIAEAGRRGLDVIVTDHHRVPAVLPDALAVVNPHRPDSVYPDRRLTGSGVAFKLACLILAEEPGGRAAALGLTDLATIGTVADVAPIVGENRAIARLGLDVMRRGPRPGLAALLERSGLAVDAVDLEAVAFTIAPRLNAAGRVGEAAEAARLLLAEDPADAAQRAEALETANTTRRDLMKTAVAEARALLEGAPDAPATLVHGPWSVGIVGLVAARLVEDRGRPAVVGAELGDVIRASCRSDGSLDLGATLEACSDLFVRHGGHAGAAGFELPADRWAEFVERFTGARSQRCTPRSPHRAARRSRAARARCRLRAASRSRAPRAVWAGQPGAACGRPRAHRDPGAGGDRRSQPADA